MPRPGDQPDPDSSEGGADSADIGAFELEPDTLAPARLRRQEAALEVEGEGRSGVDEPCSVDATGTINVPKSKKWKKFKLLEDSVELGVGETATLKLEFKRKVRKLVTKAFENPQEVDGEGERDGRRPHGKRKRGRRQGHGEERGAKVAAPPGGLLPTSGGFRVCTLLSTERSMSCAAG